VSSEVDSGTLAILGLGPNDERVYRALIGHPDVTAVELAGLTRMTRRTVSLSLADLLRAGLLETTESRHRRYRPAPPAIALRALWQRKAAELERARVVVDELIAAAAALSPARSRARPLRVDDD
jgi:sugar-specific transcriptional regulator TrmB